MGVIHVVASDSRRMSYNTLNSFIEKEGISENLQKMILLKTMETFLSFISKKDEVIKIKFYSNSCIMEIDKFKNKNCHISIYSSCVDGIFPNWRMVLPKEEDTYIYSNINREILVSKLKGILPMTKEPSYKIIIEFSHNSIDFSVKNEENFGSFSIDNFSFKSTFSEHTENVVIGMNISFLIDALNNYEQNNDFISIQVNSQNIPVLIKSGNTDRNELIMPIQIKCSEDDD